MPPSPTSRAMSIKRMLEKEPQLGDKLFAKKAIRNASFDRAAGGEFDRSKVFNGFKLKVEDTIEAGNKVVVRWRAQGTHAHAFGGIAACDKEVDFTGITIYRFERNRIVETWSEIDAAKLAATCGADRTAQVTNVLARARS